jgi:sec-independent protein translocase protein TatB
MNGTIFGIGPLEIIVILVLTLLIFGPERLPELMRGMGNALRKLRLTYIAFTQEFQGELKPIAEDIDAVTREIRQEVDAIREAADIRTLLKPYAEDVNKAINLKPLAPEATPQMIAASTATAAAAATSSIATNTIAPPATPGATAVGKPAASTPSANGNGNGKRSTIRPSTPAAPSPIIRLPDDNPWASVGVQVRSDQLDEDNPWRG